MTSGIRLHQGVDKATAKAPDTLELLIADEPITALMPPYRNRSWNCCPDITRKLVDAVLEPEPAAAGAKGNP